MTGKTTNLASALRASRCQATTHAEGSPLIASEIHAFATRCASVRYELGFAVILPLSKMLPSRCL